MLTWQNVGVERVTAMPDAAADWWITLNGAAQTFCNVRFEVEVIR